MTESKNKPVARSKPPARLLDVGQALKEYEDLIKNPESIQVYRDNRALILDAVEMRLVGDLVSKDKRKSASLNNTAYAAQVVNNIGRLERGQSTANIHSLLSVAATGAEKGDPA